MQTLFEKHLAENYTIAAFALYAACRQFRETSSTSDAGLSLQQALLLPALVFHRKTAESFARRTKTEGLFYRVMTEDVYLTVGLQERIQDRSERTFASIHLGASTEILFLQRLPEFRICASVIREPQETLGPPAPSQVKLILKAAERLGYCFATTDFSLICAALRITF